MRKNSSAKGRPQTFRRRISASRSPRNTCCNHWTRLCAAVIGQWVVGQITTLGNWHKMWAVVLFFFIYLSFPSNLHKCDGKLQFDLCKKRGSLYRSIKSYYNKESCHSNVCSVCCVMVICGCWRVWFCVVSLWSSSIPDSSPPLSKEFFNFLWIFSTFLKGVFLLTWEFLVNWDYLHRSSNSSNIDNGG